MIQRSFEDAAADVIEKYVDTLRAQFADPRIDVFAFVIDHRVETRLFLQPFNYFLRF